MVLVARLQWASLSGCILSDSGFHVPLEKGQFQSNARPQGFRTYLQNHVGQRP